MFTSQRSNLIALSLALFAGACHQAPAQESGESKSVASKEASVSSTKYRLSEAKSLGVLNASVPEEGLLCCGQLTEDQFDALSKSGYQTFINLRQRNESGTGWEAERSEDLGVRYVHIPVAGAVGVNESNARRLAATLKGAKGPTVLYCGSSNRVGALYGLGAFYTQDKSPEEALAIAESAGVTSLRKHLLGALGIQE